MKSRPKGRTSETRRKYRVAEEEPIAPGVLEAEAALEKQDYVVAERLLKAVLEANPKDYRAWFTLGFVYNSTSRSPEAIEAYRRSLAAQPDVFESNLNLGLLLASQSNPEAETFLRAAIRLKPAKANEDLARAWTSLARLLEAAKPQEALSAYGEAAALQPADPAPHLAAGLLLERQGEFSAAEQELRKAAELDPKSGEAIAGLAGLYTRSKRLPEAEAAIRQFLQITPASTQARVLLGRVLLAQGKNQEGLAALQAGLEQAPADPAVLHELAQFSYAAKSYELAASYYQRLVEVAPGNAEYHHGWGAALMKLGRYPQAEQQLIAAVVLKQDLTEAYADLAVAAYENKNYALTIKALDARAAYLPDTPKTYFLRATAYDHLRAHREAAQNYRQFLALAKGEYPTQEFQARHRLKAIDPERKK